MPTAIGENSAKKKLAADELVLCMGVNQLRTPNIAMIAAACGFDAVYIDLEHNPTSLETAAAVCVAALGMGITPIARVTSHDPHDATRILDCGAQGIMVPHVQNADEAKAIVEACLYAPKGHRSAFGSGPALGYAAIGQAEVCRRLNDETLLMAMIETPEAVGNAMRSPRSRASTCCTSAPAICRPRWGSPASTRTSACERPSRRSPRRPAPMARRWGSAGCARISNSRAGSCGSACAT
jgi:HpcH/HpaI aldolase/citrate lyase family